MKDIVVSPAAKQPTPATAPRAAQPSGALAKAAKTVARETTAQRRDSRDPDDFMDTVLTAQQAKRERMRSSRRLTKQSAQ